MFHRAFLSLTRKRSRSLPAKTTSEAKHKPTRNVRKCVAVESERPIPVPAATYAATQTGHLGSSSNVAPGTIQPAISPLRRQGDADRRVLSPARVSFCLQSQVLMHAPPPPGNTR